MQYAQPEQLPMANFVLATIIYEQARKSSADKKVPTVVLDEGLNALRRALTDAPAWPRAWALQGWLAWLRAGQERNDARHAELLQLAKDSLERAVQGNPLLKGRTS